MIAASKRELKKDEIRVEVFKEAMDLFRAKGFDQTSIEDIATAVGVSPRTLFRHFPTKADIAFVPAWEDFELLRQRVRLRPPKEALFLAAENAVKEQCDHLDSRHGTFLEIAGMRARSVALSQRRAYLMQVEFPGILAGDFSARENLVEPAPLHTVAARWTMCVLGIAVDAWLMDRSKGLREHASELIESIREGIR